MKANFMEYRKLRPNLYWGYGHQKHKTREFPSSNQVTKPQTKYPAERSHFKLLLSEFHNKKMAAWKNADQKLPVEIGNKLQIINQIRKKKVSLSADNSQVKKVHYKWLALLQIFSCVCVQYIIKLLPLTYFKRMSLPTGTSVGSSKIAIK